MDALLSYGGTLVDLSGVNHNILDDIKYGYVRKGDNIWYRKKQGRVKMNTYEIHNNNPHTQDNLNSNFNYKYMRCKTSRFEFKTYDVLNLQHVKVDPNRGKLLTYIEFMSETKISRVVIDVGDNTFKKYIKKNLLRLFPTIEILDSGFSNVELLITDDIKLHSKYDPIYTLHNYVMNDYILRGKKYFIPYSDPNIFEFVILITKTPKMDKLSREVFIKEMECFNYIYRPSCYLLKYCYKNYDNCYDCKTEIFVWEKYCRFKNNLMGNLHITHIDNFIKK
jgi:hypothetical protein